MRNYEFRDLGRLRWTEAFELQQQLVRRRKCGEIPDQFLIVEHPHVVTVGRNGRDENLLASPEVLSRTGIELYRTDRGGDVTYHGPGQIVGYPILDLRDWKRDVGAYVRAIEQMLIDTLADFGIEAGRETGMTGVWTKAGKIAAIGVHISRWITSHGFALNVSTDLDYFRYIVPCGLTKPVTSMRALGVDAPRQDVTCHLRKHFEEIFGFEYLGGVEPALELIGRVS
ncbi:MAG TPA: lipoyl(octanoyl) transferase LipB [Bryobacteraceae bacterium]|jgi:lipoate-protein ligase B